MFKLICYETCDDSQCVIFLTNSLEMLLFVNLKTALCAIYMFAYIFFIIIFLV